MVDPTTVFGYVGGSGVTVWLIRLAYVTFMKQNPTVEVAGAQSDAIKLLRDDMSRMHDDLTAERKVIELERDRVRQELQLAHKQIICLELLLAQHGIDVHAEYRARGII